MIVSEADIQDFCDRLVQEFHPDKVILFGSYARGEQREWSDVDIMVVMPFEGKGIYKSVEILNAIDPKFPIDLISLRPEDFERRGKSFDPIVRQALVGRILHESHH